MAASWARIGAAGAGKPLADGATTGGTKIDYMAPESRADGIAAGRRKTPSRLFAATYAAGRCRAADGQSPIVSMQIAERREASSCSTGSSPTLMHEASRS